MLRLPNIKPHGISSQIIALVVCVILIFAISAFTKAPPPSTVRYTYYGATAEEKAATRASWNRWDVVHSAIIVGIVGVFYYCFW